MEMLDICYLPATALRELYRRREVSPVDVTKGVLERIEQVNPSLKAFITVTPELALEGARAAEAAYLRDDAPPLAGIPTAIKDLVPTKGIRTTYGSLLHKDWVPDEDPCFVQRLYSAGIVMLGKTNTSEMGWKGDAGNRIIGPTPNPWRPDRTSGGSSGGAAAAIATGLTTLAQGGDGAGSIRIPASFCGVFGFKASFGLVPYPGNSPSLLAHTGTITRTVADSALMLSVIAGPDASDRFSFPADTGFPRLIEGGVKGLRVAWAPRLGGVAAEAHVIEVLGGAIERFREIGCSVDGVDAGPPDPWPILDTIWLASQAGAYAENLERVRDLLDPGRLPLIEAGLRLPATALAQAMGRRHDYYLAMHRFMEGYDLLLTPTMPITAFPLGADQPEMVAGRPCSYLDWTPFTYPFNLTGHPAATVPCGFASDGLPVGLQIVGRWHDDATVLRAAHAFEQIAPWNGRRPPLGA